MKISDLFRKKKIKPSYEREMRELLRENLNTISVDVFHYEDPVVQLPPEERRAYLAYFHTLVHDKKIIDRLEYLINKQANITLKNSKDHALDTAGIMKMDGLGSVRDDLKRLSVMFLKEEAERKGRGIQPADALRL